MTNDTNLEEPNIETMEVNGLNYDVLKSDDFDPNEECNIIYYFPGQGGAETDAQAYYDSIDDLGPNTVVVIQTTKNIDQKICTENFTEVIDSLGYTPSDINVTGFSKQGLYPEAAVINYIENGKYKDANISITEIDPAMGWIGDPSSDPSKNLDLDKLKDANVQISVVYGTDKPKEKKAHAEFLKKNGLDVEEKYQQLSHANINHRTLMYQMAGLNSINSQQIKSNSSVELRKIVLNNRNNGKPVVVTCGGALEKANEIIQSDLNVLFSNNIKSTGNVNNIASEGNKGCMFISGMSSCLGENLFILFSNLGTAFQSYCDLDNGLSKCVGEGLNTNSMMHFNEQKYRKDYVHFNGSPEQYKVDFSGYLNPNNSTILRKSDLENVSVKTYLEETKEIARNAQHHINSLKNELCDPNKFRGEEWNLFANILQENINCFALMEAACTRYENAYDNALKKINDYLGNDLELQFSKLDNLRAELQSVELDIANLKSNMHKTKVVFESFTIKDHKIFYYPKIVPYYSAGEISQFERDLCDAEQAKERLQKNITKLEGLPEVINAAQNEVNAAVIEIDQQFKSAVNSIY